MSAYLYDEAIVNNLRKVIGDDRIHINVVENAFNVIPRIDEDKFTLPLITLTRTSWRINSESHSHSAKYEGGLSEIEVGCNTNGNIKIKKVQFIPMQLRYSLNVWTKTREENDDFVRELYWYFLTSPTLTIKVPYDLNFHHNFNVFLEEEIEDNSDIAQHVNTGEYFRQTINLYTDDAKLWKSSAREPTTVEIKYEYTAQTLEEAASSTVSASRT